MAATAAASDHDGEMAAEMAQVDGPRQRTIRGRSRHDDSSGRPERIPTCSTSPQSGICAAGDLKIDGSHLRSYHCGKDLLLSKLNLLPTRSPGRIDLLYGILTSLCNEILR